MLRDILKTTIEAIGHSPGVPIMDQVTPGESGDYILHGSLYGISGSCRSSDRLAWPIDDLLPYCALDWAHGDGTTPAVGPTLTQVGGVAATAGNTSLVNANGRVLRSEFGSGRGWRSTTLVNPLDTDDIVIACLCRGRLKTSTAMLASTRNLGNTGLMLQTNLNVAGGRISLGIHGSTGLAVPFVSAVSGSEHLIFFVLDRGGNVRSYNNGELVDTRSIAGIGSLIGADGIGVSSLPNGTFGGNIDIARVMFFWGAGIADIADDDWVRAVTNCILANKIQNSSEFYSFDRGSLAVFQDDLGEWHIAGEYMPAMVYGEGYRNRNARTNKGLNNCNPTVSTGLTESVGGLLSVYDDSAELESNDAECFGGNVHRLTNASGSTQYVTLSNTTGNTNAHSMLTLSRIIAGSPELGWLDASSGVFTKLDDLDNDYAVTRINNVTPPDTDVRMTVLLNDGDDVTIIGHTLVEDVIVIEPIINIATAAAAVQLQDQNIAQTYSPPTDKATVTATVKADQWTGVKDRRAGLIDSELGPEDQTYVDPAGNQLRSNDGTSVIVDGGPFDGTDQEILLSYGNDRALELDGVRTEGSFDGEMAWNGGFGFGTRATEGPDMTTKNLEVRRSEQ